MKVAISSLLFLLTVFGSSYAASNDQDLDRKQIYELEERCHDSAEKFFEHRYGSGYDNRVMGRTEHYTNHYNKKLNKCFILITTEFKPKEENVSETDYELWDINENNPYALLSMDNNSNKLVTCLVLGKRCSSKKMELACCTIHDRVTLKAT